MIKQILLLGLVACINTANASQVGENVYVLSSDTTIGIIGEIMC